MHRYRYALTLAWFGVRRHPRSSMMATVVMALGLAACMTVLTVFHTLADDPLHGRGNAVDTLLLEPQGSASGSSQALLEAGAAQQIVAQAGQMPVMAMVSGLGKVRTDEAQGSSVDHASVVAATSRVGSVFDIPLVRGHWWTAQDDRQHVPVAVVSEKTARRLFGTDAVLGKAIETGGKTLRIIGVRGAWQPTLQFYAQGASVYYRTMAQVLLPLSVAADAQMSVSAVSDCRGSFMADPWRQCSVAQLWGYRLDAAQRRQLVNLVRQFGPHVPDAKPFRPVFMNVPAWLQLQHVLPDSVRVYVWVAVAFLALCLFNAAGVLAARFMRRGSEVGVRRALGAARRDVFAQHLFESGCLALTGGGFSLCHWCTVRWRCCMYRRCVTAPSFISMPVRLSACASSRPSPDCSWAFIPRGVRRQGRPRCRSSKTRRAPWAGKSS